MSGDNVKIASLKLKLKSVTKQKLSVETDVLKLRNKERCFTEELAKIKAEKEFLREQLEALKGQISQTTHQISMIDICMTSERSKIENHINVLNQHSSGFQQLFDKERQEHDLKLKEQREKDAEQQELMRQKERELAEKNEQQALEVATVEEECEAIERECAVLKKRNNAIMLKLRKKLLETENARRELMNKNASDVAIE